MTKRPNIIYILNDHQAHYGHGRNGGPAILRPRFDRLASEGIGFDRAYSSCPLCGPARRTMLTGLYPHTHGELKNDTDHPFDRETYLDLLAANGYRTYYYGKWHAGPGTALDHASEGLSYPSYNNPYTKPEYKAYLAAQRLPEPQIMIEHSFWPKVLSNGRVNNMVEGQTYRQDGLWCNEHASGIMTTPKETHEAFFLAHLATSKLEEIAASAEDEPFHLRVDFWGPHQPYFPTQEFVDLYDPASIPEYGNFRDDLRGKPEIYHGESNTPLHENNRLIIPNPLAWSTWQEVLSRCYAQISLVDEAGGLILDALQRTGLAENTLVVWSTDHGDGVACHGGHFDKRSYMPEEMVRVPWAMRFPGRISPGQRSQARIGTIDLAPTILDVAGIGFSNPVHGRSLLPLAAGESAEWRDEIMCETHGHMEDHVGRLVAGERYKYVWNRNQLDELYDLESDPYELRNLVDDPAMAGILAGMRERLDRWQEQTADPERRS